MCNLYRLHKGPDAIRALFAAQQMPLGFPEGAPNLQPADIRITDMAPIVRPSADGTPLELVMRRWSWPGPGGKPVYNFRSDNREFTSGRCLVLADGFYEFTTSNRSEAEAERSLAVLATRPGHFGDRSAGA